MKTGAATLYLCGAWVVTCVMAYGFGWWRGVKSVTTIAAGAAGTGFSLILYALVVVAVVAAIGAFFLRGYFDHRPTGE